MPPLRVLHVIPSVSPRDGGPTRAIGIIERALSKAGVHVTTPDDLSRAVNKAMDSGRPTLINAVIDPAAGTESGSIGKLNPQSAVRKK